MGLADDRYEYDPERRRVYDTVTKKHLNIRYIFHRDGRSKARSLNKLHRQKVTALESVSKGYVGV